MSRNIATVALAAMLTLATSIPAAQADRGRGHHYNNAHHSYQGSYRSHRGNGHWRNGRWIGLGILGAAAIGALDDGGRDCYRRYGRRYCN
jgi:hypothetical protein